MSRVKVVGPDETSSMMKEPLARRREPFLSGTEAFSSRS
jgi:hypothetical protein